MNHPDVIEIGLCPNEERAACESATLAAKRPVSATCVTPVPQKPTLCKVFNAATDTKGRDTNTNIIYTGPTETLHPAACWGPCYKGPTIDAYPLPEELSFEDTRIPSCT